MGKESNRKVSIEKRISNVITGLKRFCHIRYLGPLVLLAEQVGVSIGLKPVLFKGVDPHQLPVAQVVNLTPLFLRCNTCQELLLGLHRAITT